MEQVLRAAHRVTVSDGAAELEVSLSQIPTVGRIVHYMSYGTPGGEYPSVCRAAVVAEVTSDPMQVGLVVLNPEGLFFNRSVRQSEEEHKGGTWHWPERA